MNTVLVVARVGLAFVFAVAAFGKLADMRGWRTALEGFNVPRQLVPTVAVVLPIAELASVLTLLLEPTVPIGAALALALLLAFIGGITAALRRGTRPDCHCFGQLQSEPVGTETLVRNVLLGAVAVLVLIGGPGPAIDGWARTSNGNLVALAAVSLIAIVLAYVCYLQWRVQHPAVRRAVLPPADMVILQPGQPVPSFAAANADGTTVSSAELLAEAPRSVLVFTSATCGPCVSLLPELARWRRQLAGRIAIHVLSAGDETESRRIAEEHELAVLLDPDSAAATAVGVHGTPSALAVDKAGRVMTMMAVGAPSIEAMIRAVLKRPAGEVELAVHQVPSPTEA